MIILGDVINSKIVVWGGKKFGVTFPFTEKEIRCVLFSTLTGIIVGVVLCLIIYRSVERRRISDFERTHATYPIEKEDVQKLLACIPKKNGIWSLFQKVFYRVLLAVKNKVMEDILLGISMLILAISIISSWRNEKGFSVVVIELFSTFVMSWLITKKSANVELKKQEEALAIKSKRYLDSLEINTRNAEKFLYGAQNNAKKLVDEKEKNNILENAVENALISIGVVNNGINAAKLDWEDLMTPEEIEKNRSKKTIDLSPFSSLLPKESIEASKVIDQDETVNQNNV